jgi:hypothetical protein
MSQLVNRDPAARDPEPPEASPATGKTEQNPTLSAPDLRVPPPSLMEIAPAH